MQRAILILPQDGSVLCQGLHWQHGESLNSLLSRYHGSPEAAEMLVTGNRISSIGQDGIPERNTFKADPIRYKSVLHAIRRQECITAHVYTPDGWAYVNCWAGLSAPSLTFYADPGHAWLRVRRSAAEAIMGTQFAKLTGYSYQRDSWIYLEGDLDAGAFLTAAKRVGITFRIQHRHTNNRSRIRSYDSLSV